MSHRQSHEAHTECKYCKEIIHLSAQVCKHCGRDQRKWINKLQYLATITAFIMVLIVAVQAYIGYQQNELSKIQTDEAKKKRIEAEEVLAKARTTFANVSANSIEMKVKTAKVLSEASATALLTRQMTDTANKSIKETKSTFHELAVTLTEPVTASLALQGNLMVYIPLKDKIEQIDNVSNSLRKLGVSEKDIEKAIDPFTSMISYKHKQRILYLLNEQLPNNKKLFKEISEINTNEWSLKQIYIVIKDNNIQPSKELHNAILDLEYYEKNKKLRRENSWQG